MRQKLLDQPLTMLRARSASRAASAMAARAPAAGAARLPLNFIQQRGMAGKDIKFGNDARALLLQVCSTAHGVHRWRRAGN